MIAESYREKILSALDKYDNFEWLSSLEYPDRVRQYLTAIDVYALVSEINMSPFTLQEAQLTRKPVVATNVGRIQELMRDNETGFLVVKGNAEKWIEKPSLVINDIEQAKQMGIKGRQFVVDNFSWEIVTKDVVKKIENLVLNKKKKMGELE